MERDAASAGPAVERSKNPATWFSRKRRHEASCLRIKITEKAATETNRNPEQLRCYLEHRFEAPLVKYGRRGPLYGRAFTCLSVVVIAAGFASSAISVSDQDPGELRWVVFALGVVVSLFTAINQLWKPGLRSVGSYRAGNSLRREGWDYVFDRGHYELAAKTHGAFDLFLDQVKEIQSRVDAIDELQAEGSGSDDGGQKPNQDKDGDADEPSHRRRRWQRGR